MTSHRSTRWLARATISAAAIMPAFLTAAPWTLRAAISLLSAAGLLMGYRNAGWLRGERFVESIVWNADGRWLMSRGGKTWEVTLRGDSWNSGIAMLLRWEALEGMEPPVSTLITVLDVGPTALRRLGIRLRIDGPRAMTATDSLLA